ncbi:MAG: helix-turn-helix transcriptional regulator [Agathobacter sp.]|nr:helix-turn-helix transcriptional regulator [Agathobacter sp.]
MKTFPVLDPVATGARIRELRNANRLTVDDVREFLGLESTQAIYKWQRGESLPTIDNLYALSTLFGTSVDDILIGSREEDERSSSFIIKIQWLVHFIKDDIIKHRYT